MVWGSVGREFNSKGELDVRVVRAVTWRTGNLHGSRMGYLPYLISFIYCPWLNLEGTIPPSSFHGWLPHCSSNAFALYNLWKDGVEVLDCGDGNKKTV